MLAGLALSWDLISQPGRRLAQLSAHLHDPGSLAKALALTLALTVLLAAAYSVFYLLLSAQGGRDLGRERLER